MEENKTYRLIYKHLLEQYAYSLVVGNDSEGNKQLLLDFRNCYDIEPLVKECKSNGINLGDGSLGVILSEAKNNLRQMSVGSYPLNLSLAEHEFFIGERLRLRTLSRAIVDMVKVEDGRWWVMQATQDISFLRGLFVCFKNNIGPNMEMELAGKILKIDTANFIVSNKTSMIVDKILCPGLYRYGLDSSSLEDILIIPAYKMAEYLLSNTEIKYSTWNNYLEKAYGHSIDSSTAWNIANAVINNYDVLYE